MQKVEYKKADILKSVYRDISVNVIILLVGIYLIVDLGLNFVSIIIIVFGGYNLGKIMVDFVLDDVYKLEGLCYYVEKSGVYLGIAGTTVTIEDAEGNEEEIKFNTMCTTWDLSHSGKVIIYFTKRSKIILGGKNIMKKRGEGKLVLIIYGILIALILLTIIVLNIVY